MTNCTFCGAAIEAGTGKMYIKRDGSVLHFDSAKCQRNMVGLGRVNRHVKWTQAAANAKVVAAHAAKAEPKAAKATKAAKAPKAAPAPKAK
jgi:large subunit ribosomal protein L24e